MADQADGPVARTPSWRARIKYPVSIDVSGQHAAEIEASALEWLCKIGTQYLEALHESARNVARPAQTAPRDQPPQP